MGRGSISESREFINLKIRSRSAVREQIHSCILYILILCCHFFSIFFDFLVHALWRTLRTFKPSKVSVKKQLLYFMSLDNQIQGERLISGGISGLAIGHCHWMNLSSTRSETGSQPL